MFGIVANLRNMLIAAALAFVLGGVAGWRVEAWRSNSAYYKAQMVNLQKQLRAAQAAQEKDAGLYTQAQQAIEDLKRKAQDAEDRTVAGQCLSPDDTERLRNLWKR